MYYSPPRYGQKCNRCRQFYSRPLPFFFSEPEDLTKSNGTTPWRYNDNTRYHQPVCVLIWIYFQRHCSEGHWSLDPQEHQVHAALWSGSVGGRSKYHWWRGRGRQEQQRGGRETLPEERPASRWGSVREMQHLQEELHQEDHWLSELYTKVLSPAWYSDIII